MCGIVGILGKNAQKFNIEAMLQSQTHRGPDANKTLKVNDYVLLGHNRLSIIDLSDEANQPMQSQDNRYTIVFNGEIYNYLELKKELSDFTFHTSSDTEVLLNGYRKWGKDLLPKLIGMFSFGIYDSINDTFFVVRDRFGVKPFNYSFQDNTLIFASEIKAIFASGVEKKENDKVWAGYFANGTYGNPDETFWKGINQLPGGHYLEFKNGEININRWYNFVENVNSIDVNTPEAFKYEYYEELLKNTIELRFRADVPVGFNLSGGLDSSTLLALIKKYKGENLNINAFTFTTGDDNYDELPWVKDMISHTGYNLVECRLTPENAIRLATVISKHQDEPFGGLPTIAYANIFKTAREMGTIVLLDGQGMDEAWAGYDYYVSDSGSVIQGTAGESPVRPECLDTEFLGLAEKQTFPKPFNDKVKDLQYRDIFYTKIPRALRFNDRVSMAFSTELREPFLDHRMVEFAFAQHIEFKIKDGNRKWMLRQIASKYLPGSVSNAPKRALQTPQREWLKNELKDLMMDSINKSITNKPEWFNKSQVEKNINQFLAGESNNSFYIWQWMSLGL